MLVLFVLQFNYYLISYDKISKIKTSIYFIFSGENLLKKLRKNIFGPFNINVFLGHIIH